MHDKGGIAESLYVYIKRASVRWGISKYAHPLFEELLKFIAHGHILEVPHFLWTGVEMRYKATC